MSKHAAPAPAALEHPEPYLLTAAAVAGLLLGAAGVSAPLAVAAAVALATLALTPAPGDRKPRAARRHIPGAVYTPAVGLALTGATGVAMPSRTARSEALRTQPGHPGMLWREFQAATATAGTNPSETIRQLVREWVLNNKQGATK